MLRYSKDRIYKGDTFMIENLNILMKFFNEYIFLFILYGIFKIVYINKIKVAFIPIVGKIRKK